MSKIQENISLQPFNTFGIDVKAKYYCNLSAKEDLIGLLPQLKKLQHFFLGGGSNVLFTQDYNGLVIHNQIKGKEILNRNEEKVKVKVYSGEIWHEFVLWTLENEAYGLENMSLIPGTLGAAPIQNIGAYGEEIKNWCTTVEAINLETGEIKIFSHDECKFGYRESVFKNELKGKYFIYALTFELNTLQSRNINSNYGDIKKILLDKNIIHPTPQDISQAVIAIRSSKLPDFTILGNAGSFFKNPIVSSKIAEKVLNHYPTAPNFPTDEGVKIPAGWLIETCGFKGKRIGKVGSHKDQALVIVNFGNATGEEIYQYSQLIIDTVETTFGIVLEREVNVI